MSGVSAIAVVTGSVGITDTIITNQAMGIERMDGTVHEDYNLFFGNTANISGTAGGGTHDVFSDPNFANPTIDNYHILSPSAAIDVGINAGIYTDLDGNTRPARLGFDISAYEYQYLGPIYHISLPLILR